MQDNRTNLSLIRKRRTRNIMIIISLMIIISVALFLLVGINIKYIDYVLGERVPKLFAIVLSGTCIASSTIVFQTIVNNKILTPSVLGLDSLYILIQTMIVFFIGISNPFMTNKIVNFLISVTIMVILSLVLFKKIFSKTSNITLMLLLGMVMGTLFKSISTFMQVMIDPNEYLALQNQLYASFGNVNTKIILISLVLIVMILPFVVDDLKYLDVLGLGKFEAISLGVEYDKLVKKFIIVVAILVSISTALVGPLTFLGLLVTNISYELFKTYKHSILIVGASLISVLTLVLGETIIQHVFNFNTTLSILINFVGGIYFIFLLMRGVSRD